MKLKNNRRNYTVDPEASLENRWLMFSDLIKEKGLEKITKQEFEIYVPELVEEVKKMKTQKLYEIIFPDVLKHKKKSNPRATRVKSKA